MMVCVLELPRSTDAPWPTNSGAGEVERVSTVRLCNRVEPRAELAPENVGVVAVAAGEAVVAGAPFQPIGARAAGQRVVAGIAGECIGAAAGADRVVTPASIRAGRCRRPR